MSFKHLTVRREGAVERISLNRPEVRNAFNETVIMELTWWAESVAADRSVRAVVLSGEGPVFCAGADLAWMERMAGFTLDENMEDASALSRMFVSLDRLPLPVIGLVHGAALGGGAGLAAICDIVVAAETAVFGFTEVRLGLVPAVIAPFVVAKIGRAAARELFLTGARFPAHRAASLGLVQAVVPEAGTDEAANAYLRDVLASPPGALAAAKKLVAEIGRRGSADVGALCAETIAERRASPEGQEGIRAFLEKRAPRWPHVPDTDAPAGGA